ncbi:uncharacterized protein RB166_020059 [Leptodactylus fuscus]|uniref:uncharacterized protein LOC142185348 n=1 Tax=Leptodactylus fuscus TaxID=238119 RepID=UPI003F4E4CCC
MILLQIPLLCLLYGDGWGNPLIPHVTAPGTWRLGVLESVVIRTPQQSEGFPVKVSLLSYPDKKTTFSSALLPLTPDNHFQGVVKLSITAEDSPGEFLYLMVESKVFREEARIPVSREARTPMDEPDKSNLRRSRRQSVRSVLTETQIQRMTAVYQPHPRLLKCCRDGSDHYSQHENCDSKHIEELKPNCYRVYGECCKYTEKQMVKRTRVSGLEQNPVLIYPEERNPVLIHPEERIAISVTHTGPGGVSTRTFISRMDQDLSVQVSSKMSETEVKVSFRAPPPTYGDQ